MHIRPAALLLPAALAACGSGDVEPHTAGTPGPPECPLDETQRRIVSIEARRLRLEASRFAESSENHVFPGGKGLFDRDEAGGTFMIGGGCPTASGERAPLCRPPIVGGADECATVVCEGTHHARVTFQWGDGPLEYAGLHFDQVRYAEPPRLEVVRTPSADGRIDMTWSSADVVEVEHGGHRFDLGGVVTGSLAADGTALVEARYDRIVAGRELRIVFDGEAIRGTPTGSVLLDGEEIGAFPLVMDEGEVFFDADGCIEP